MFGTRIHGRGGQGVVTAAEVLSVAAFNEGHHSQAFPSFGSERTGAPVVSYCRIGPDPIRTREPIGEPDALIVQDPTLLSQVDLLAGLHADGYLLINTTKPVADLGLAEFAAGHRADRLLTVPATEIARRVVGRPVPNVVLLGGFAAMTGMVGLDSLRAAVMARFGGDVGERNGQAAAEAYEFVAEEQSGLVGRG